MRGRLAKLERRVDVERPEPPMLVLGAYGYRCPKECRDALIAEARARAKGSGLLFVELFEEAEDGRYVCRHCGQEHLFGPEQARLREIEGRHGGGS